MAMRENNPVEIPVTPNNPPNPISIPNPRPRSRAHYVVSTPVCYYYEGEVSIEAGSNIESITTTITRLEDNVQYTNAVSGNVLTIQVSEDPGTYILQFTMSDGTGYHGEYTLY